MYNMSRTPNTYHCIWHIGVFQIKLLPIEIFNPILYAVQRMTIYYQPTRKHYQNWTLESLGRLENTRSDQCLSFRTDSFTYHRQIHTVRACSFERLQMAVVSGCDQQLIVVSSCAQLGPVVRQFESTWKWQEAVGSGCRKLSAVVSNCEQLKAVAFGIQQLRTVESNCSWPNAQKTSPQLRDLRSENRHLHIHSPRTTPISSRCQYLP